MRERSSTGLPVVTEQERTVTLTMYVAAAVRYMHQHPGRSLTWRQSTRPKPASPTSVGQCPGGSLRARRSAAVAVWAVVASVLLVASQVGRFGLVVTESARTPPAVSPARRSRPAAGQRNSGAPARAPSRPGHNPGHRSPGQPEPATSSARVSRIARPITLNHQHGSRAPRARIVASDQSGSEAVSTRDAQLRAS